MKVFTLIGLSGSGKTSTIECLIKEFKKRGYSVGTVKEIHFEDFCMDTPGKNTYRHRQAGADTVSARGLKETDVLYKGKMPIYDLLAHYCQDIVIMEGVRDAVVPEIVLCQEDHTPKVSDLTFAVSGRYSLNGQKEYRGLPIINGVKDTARLADLIEKKVPHLMYDFDKECCGKCGMDCRSLLAEILKGKAQQNACILHKNKINLQINNKDIPMVPFVQNLLSNVIVGVVKELKGYKENAPIDIKIY